MDSRVVRIFCANFPSQKARRASYNLLSLLRKDCLFCHRSECYGSPPSYDQSGIHKEPLEKAQNKGKCSWEIPRWGRSQERSKDQNPSIVLT